MSNPLNRSFTRSDAAHFLGLSEEVIDALVASGRLRAEGSDGLELFNADQFEALFRDGLLALYRAVAAPIAEPAHDETEISLDAEEQVSEAEAAPADIAAAVEEDEDEAYEQQEEDHRKRPELRRAPRYIPRRQIDGMFNRVRFSIVQLSSSGLRIRHQEPVLAGNEGKVSFALLNPPRSIFLKAHVVWTSIARYGEYERTFWISGLRAIENTDRLAEAVDLLLEARQLEPDRRVEPRASKVLMPPGGVTGATDDEIAEIIKVAHRFGADPVESARWIARAKFAMADERVRKSAPPKMRNREEVLAIWECIDRRIEIAKIAAVVTWMRKTRPAASPRP